MAAMHNVYTHQLALTLWIFPVGLQIVIGVAMVRRRLLREFPFFFAYTLFHILQELPLLYAYFSKNEARYFALAWTGEFIGGLLGLLVIHEIFEKVFRPYEALKRLGTVSFRWCFIILLVISATAALYAPGGDPEKLLAGLLIWERSLRVIQLGLLLFLFLFVAYFGLSWKHYVFGIGLGFGFYAGADLIAMAIRTGIGSTAGITMNFIRTCAYNGAAVVWTTYFVVPAPQPVRAVYAVPSTTLEEWNEALLQVLKK